MKIRVAVCLCALAGLVVLGAGLGFGEDEGEQPKPPMSEQEMWMKMMQWAQPGEHHEPLGALAGKWKTQGTMHTSNGPIQFEGEAENAWILGNRFLESKYSGPFMGQPFEGRSFVGYDNGKQQYQSVWIMTMGTGIDFTTGTWDAESKTFTWTGGTYMPDGKTYKKREVMVVESDTRLVATSYSTGPDGKERKEMDMIYTKVVPPEGD